MPQDDSHAASMVAAAKHAAAKAALDDSSSDDGQQDLGGHVSQSGIGKPKRWSWNATEAYFVNILIKTCVEVYSAMSQIVMLALAVVVCF